MLIDFSVQNYRSIKQKQLLSLASAKGSELQETNTFQSDIPNLPGLLRSAIMYGANASGKSNVVKALGFMHFFVLNSFGALQEGQLIPVKPFLFDPETSKSPSEFEITFVSDAVRYQYGFAATQQRIIGEWLIAYPEGKPQRWFDRVFDQSTSAYEWRFSRHFLGQKEVIKTATRSNALFLSTAIQLNNDQLKPVFGWFLNKLEIILPGADINLQFTIDRCSSEEEKRRVLAFMNAADMSIVNIQLEKKPFDPAIVPPFIGAELREKLIADMRGKELTAVNFVHDAGTGSGVLDLHEESQGTQKLFAFAGPWLDVLSRGRILIIDELDTSLHPLLVRHLISLFHTPGLNRNNAQLVITTHDTTLLDPDIFRRDQVWFTEKNANGATSLYSLVEFKPRKNEAFERGYLKGRYGALPFIGEFAF